MGAKKGGYSTGYAHDQHEQRAHGERGRRAGGLGGCMRGCGALGNPIGFGALGFGLWGWGVGLWGWGRGFGVWAVGLGLGGARGGPSSRALTLLYPHQPTTTTTQPLNAESRHQMWTPSPLLRRGRWHRPTVRVRAGQGGVSRTWCEPGEGLACGWFLCM